VQNSEEIKERNFKIIIKIIDEMFDNPRTKEEFIHHLSGGCSIPRKPKMYTYAKKPMTPIEKKKELGKERTPFFLFKNMGKRKIPVMMGGKSKKRKRNHSNFHHKTVRRTSLLGSRTG
jgi:hypothetical protein